MRSRRLCLYLIGKMKGRTRTMRIASLFLVTILFFGASVALAELPQADAEKLSLERFPKSVKAPDFVLTDINGKEVSLSHYRGKPLLLYFWATW